jgi:hypothetical protein
MEKLIELLFGWIPNPWTWWQRRQRRKVVENWLRDNTRDEPGDSHRKLSDIALNLGMSEDEVNKSIVGNSRIFRSTKMPDHVSVWRQEPESIYEKRGVLAV